MRNDEAIARSGVTLVEKIPAGFKYRPGSATIDGVTREPTVAGNQLSWAGISIAPKKSLVLKLVLVPGAGLLSGEYVNEAWVIDSLTGVITSNVGSAKFRVVPDATFDCTDIIGKVFDDVNRNGYPDDGERGIANVRLVTVNGQIITTDSEGRYHIACADIPHAYRGSNYVLKLDVRSLPTGYRPTTENPQSSRLTSGKMAKMNFGAAITRVVRIDVMEAAFQTDSPTLQDKWVRSLQELVQSLAEQQSVLRIAYKRGAQEDKSLATQRVQAIESLVLRVWKDQGGKGQLPIESEIYFDQEQPPQQGQTRVKSDGASRKKN